MKILADPATLRDAPAWMRRTYLILVALVACRDKAPEPPPPPPPPHDGVTLLQAGAPPLAPLRYHLTRGTKTAAELVCDVDIKSDDRSGPMPTLVVDLETTVEDVLGDGSARLRITVVDTRIRDRPGSQVASDVMQAQATAMRGVVLTETLAPDGAVSDAQVIPPVPATRPAGGPSAADVTAKASGRLDSLLRSLERMAMRLPAEPVGIGATWSERRTLPEGGIRATSEIRYTLVSITGSTLAYTGAGQSSGTPQTVEQDGVKIEVADTHGRSEVQGSIDLARYTLDGMARSTFSSSMTVIAPDAGPGAARSTVEITMAVRMTPLAGGTAGAAAAPPAAAPATPDDAASPDETGGSGGHGGHGEQGGHDGP
ncbi:MAG TPA: DUF6263 family protein [Kofleriaceae bacterium]|jgi:hypothetical protein